jgi:fibronectin type 3 domain-containing protein
VITKFLIRLLVLLLPWLVWSQLMAANPTNPGSSVTLAWDPSPSTNMGVLSYKVYYGVSSTAYTNTVSAGTNLTATVTNLLRGKTYYFAATAIATNGLESAYSIEVSTTIPSIPAAPTGLSITITQ